METPWRARFFTIWGGQAISLLGSQLVQFALIWYLTEQTGSATALAMATLVGMAPQIFLSPIIGALVDRWDRRRVMLAADGGVALATLLLALLFAAGQAGLWAIYALLFARALGGAFHQSAMGASTVLLVPREQLSRVQGLNAALYGGMNILSAPLGALLLALLPMQGILLIDVGTALCAIGPLLFLRIPAPPAREAPAGGGWVWRDIGAALRYIGGWPGLAIIIGMAMLINLLATPLGALTPLLVTGHFGGAAPELAALQAAMGVGTIAGGALLGIWGGFKRRIVTALLGLILLGLSTLAIGLTPSGIFALAVGAIFVTGLVQPLVNGSLGAVIQGSVAPEMQGRVFGLVMSLSIGITPLSLLLAGPLADTLGIQAWYMGAGVVCALLGAAGFLIPPVMRIEDGPGATSAPSAQGV